MPRRTLRRRNHQVTVSLTSEEYELVSQAAFREQEPIGVWLRGLGVLVASDGKVVRRPLQKLFNRPTGDEERRVSARQSAA